MLKPNRLNKHRRLNYPTFIRVCIVQLLLEKLPLYKSDKYHIDKTIEKLYLQIH
jgi:hypothetical protein